MESSENSAWENCPHFTTPPLVFPRLSILRATSGGVVEFWQLSQALKNLLWELILPQKYRWNSGGVVKKRESPEVGISDIEVFTFSLDHFVTNTGWVFFDSRHIKFSKQNTAMLIVLREN